MRTVYGCDVAEHAVRRYGGGDGIRQADLRLGQLVLVREEDSDRVQLLEAAASDGALDGLFLCRSISVGALCRHVPRRC